eukprot:m.40221 g.40221  ORF g.40221 m.40221 type:complete len:469 (+) comp9637_c0_seq2:101-1507(+)
MSNQQVDVVVVGAGLAGLSAASKLLENHTNVSLLVLEGRERVGGRTNTVALEKGHIVDAGGQWIGPTHHRLLELVREINGELEEQYYPETYTSRLTEVIGYPLQPLTTQEANDVSRYIDLIDKMGEDMDCSKPWAHSKATEYDMLSVANHIESLNISEAAGREIGLFAQTVLATDPSEISLLFFIFYVKSGGGMEALGDGEEGAQKWKLKGGMQQISEHLLRKVSGHENASVKFNTAVAKCEIVKDENGSSVVNVLTNSGTIAAKHVIIAFAPQLIASSLSFEPPLPQKQASLFSNFTPGYAVKVIILYANAFWMSAKENDEKKTTHFQDLGYVHNLFHSVVRSDSATESPAIVGLITGKSAQEFGKLTADERKEKVLTQLVRMYETEDARSPIEYLEKIWADESFSKGCFAGICPPNGVYADCGQFLRSPHGPIQFASTEMTEEFYGYMEGAIRSGYDAANKIAENL